MLVLLHERIRLCDMYSVPSSHIFEATAVASLNSVSPGFATERPASEHSSRRDALYSRILISRGSFTALSESISLKTDCSPARGSCFFSSECTWNGMYSTPTLFAPICFSFLLRIFPQIFATKGLGDQEGMGSNSFTHGISFVGFFMGSMTVGW